jgi:integrase
MFGMSVTRGSEGRVAGRLVVGEIRVQEVVRGDGRRAYTILLPGGEVYRMPDGFLRTCAAGTDRTYAYLLVDHLRWLAFEGLRPETATLGDLQRYMAALGAEYAGPFGRPWRTGKRPYGQSALATTAACLKGFYVYQGSHGVHRGLAEQLGQTRLPTTADRRRAMLGHVLSEMPANPLTPKSVRRRHPRMPPEGARARLVETLPAARDRMLVTWLADGGFRIGELCGLHLLDLHLREDAGCGECRSPHVHICHRETNLNQARAKAKAPWVIEDGTVRGGLIRRASPAMIHTYFEYMTSEYSRGVDHGMLLVQLHGPHRGQPWATTAARGMLRRAGIRLELGRVRPHSFRHRFATGVLDASGGNTVLARDAGGWTSATTVEQVYGHVDVHDPAFVAVLNHVWGDQA